MIAVMRHGLSSTTAVSRSEASLSARSTASSGAGFGVLVCVATADLRGVPRRVVMRPSSGRGGRCRSWSHGLLRREPADEDQPPLLAMRTDHRLDRGHRLCVDRLWRRDAGVLRRLKLERRPQLQHLPDPSGVVALRRMPQTEVADLVEAARQHMLEEAAHELLAAEAAGPRVAGLAVLVLDGDRFVVEADDARVGESDAKDV